jgi:hypothetical protein
VAPPSSVALTLRPKLKIQFDETFYSGGASGWSHCALGGRGGIVKLGTTMASLAADASAAQDQR